MTTETKGYFVVMEMCLWKNLELNFGALKMGASQFGSVGFLPVFDTVSQAKAYRKEHQSTASIQAIATGRGR